MTTPDDRSFDLAWPVDDTADAEGSNLEAVEDIEISDLWAPDDELVDDAPGRDESWTEPETVRAAEQVEPVEPVEPPSERRLLTLRVRLADKTGGSASRRSPRI